MALSIKLVRLKSPRSVKDPELSKIAAQSSRGPFTEHHILKIDRREVCFLSYDIRHDRGYLVLSEMFVPKELRHLGIGVMSLLVSEMFTIRQGLTKIILTPSPLDREINKTDLTNWYKRHGYKKISGRTGELEKTVLTFKVNKIFS